MRILRVLGLAGLILGMLPTLGLAAASGGCGGAGLASGLYTFVSGGITRTFRLYVPPGYDPATPMPLVVMFHGLGGNENDFLNDASLLALAKQRGYLLAAPRGLGGNAPDFRLNSWAASGSSTGLDGDGVNPAISGDTAAICRLPTSDRPFPSCRAKPTPMAKNNCAWSHCQANDIAFAIDLTNRLEGQLCVDTARVFAAGESNGGIFSWTLGQSPSAAPLFRAIASIVGVPLRGYLAGPAKASGMPVLLVTGSYDVIVPPGQWESTRYTTNIGGVYFTGAAAITRIWASANGCQRSIAAPFDDGSASTDCRTYCDSAPNWPKVLECRSKEAHSFKSLTGTWKLMFDFFGHV